VLDELSGELTGRGVSTAIELEGVAKITVIRRGNSRALAYSVLS